MRHIHAIMHYLCICSADLAIMHVGQIQAGFLMHIVLGVGVVNPSSNSRGGLSGAKRPFPINLSVRPYVAERQSLFEAIGFLLFPPPKIISY